MAVNKLYNMYEKAKKNPRDYGCGVLLYSSDIHMIEMIKNYPDANTTQLAEKLGVTKGLVSRLIKKLDKKGLIVKYQYVDNKKEVYFKLTDLGERAFRGHIEFHNHKNKRLHDKIDSYNAEDKRKICDFLREYTEGLEALIIDD